MSLKLFLFLALAAMAAVEARDFFKSIRGKDLTQTFSPRFKDVHSLVRRRRAAESSEESLEITDDAVASLMKFFIAAAWEGEKHETLAGFIEEMSASNNNLTLIAWQRVSDDDGKVQEIRTMQLVIPPKPEDRAHNIVDDDDDDDDDDDSFLPHDDIKEMKEMFKPMELMGIPASITVESYDKEGEQDSLLYLDKDELFVHAYNFSVYNKTAVATPQEVSDFITSLKPAAFGKPSVLKYDVDGKLLAEESNIKPYLWGDVVDHHEAPDNILIESPQIIADVSVKVAKSDIPKELATRFNKNYPEYKWRVIVDPDNYYVTRDVAVTLAYDNYDLEENTGDTYLVYGVKK